MLLVALGFFSCCFVLFLSLRMKIVDSESMPLSRLPSLLLYWGWLGGEIVKSNLDVSRLILTPDLEITPGLVRVRTDKRSDLASVVFANSITLTSGTVSVELEDRHIIIHTLTAGMADLQAFQTIGASAQQAVDGHITLRP